MLLLLFHVDNDIYGLDLARIIEIVPLVELKVVPHAPELLAGIFNYRGTIVPVVDISRILSGRDSKPLLSTRIVVVGAKVNDKKIIFGILAERATETILCDENEFQEPGFDQENVKYLKNILLTDTGMIYMLDFEKLSSDNLFVSLDIKEI